MNFNLKYDNIIKTLSEQNSKHIKESVENVINAINLYS